MTTVTIDDVRAAAAAIEGAVERTHTAKSDTLSAITGAEVWIKFEQLQYTSSFKERGARNRLLAVPGDAAARGVVAVSAGNHAQAVAHHASLLGVTSTIVMPVSTPITKVSRTEQNGARVVIAGETLEESFAVARSLVADTGATFIPPYDDPLIIAGQGTVALEFVADAPPLDALVVPVGGGGLFSGCCVAMRAISPATELIGVQSELYPAMLGATGRPEPSPPESWGPTIAEGIAVKNPGELTTAIITDLADDVIVAPEAAIEEAVVRFLEIEKVMAEGAGAAGLAALLAHPARFEGKRVGIILSGGNIDLRLLSSVIMRGLARTGRLARFVVEVDDLPGGLARLTGLVADSGANVVDLWHHREFGRHSARVTEVELLVETRDDAHVERLTAVLEAAGYVLDNEPRRMS